MSKKIDNHLLDKIGNPKKLIERSLENQLLQAESSLGADASGLISKILLLFIPKEGSSLQLPEAEIEERLLVDQNISSSEVRNILEKLKESGILIAENGNYEIISPVLANHIYEKIEAESRINRKVETFIHERHTIFQENKILLTQEDLNYINPYLSTINISSEEAAFIEKSTNQIIRKKRRSRVRTILIILFLALTGIVSTIGFFFVYKMYEESELAKRRLDVIAQKLRLAEKDEIAKNKLLESQNKELDEAKRKAEKDSEENKKLATENIKLAKEAQAEADKNEALAIKNDSLAKVAQREADLKDEEAQKALESEAAAKKSEAKAKKEAQKNADLNAIILSRNIAKQATQLDDKEAELKAILAKDAFQINVDSKEYGNTKHPDIYNALYDALRSLYKLKKKEDFNQISNERGAIRSIVFDKSGNTFYTVGSSGALKKWEITKWNNIEKPEFHQTTIDQLSGVQNVLKISDDDQWLVVGGKKGDIQLYNLNNSKEPRSINLHNGQEVFDIVFVPDNSGFISCGADKTLQFYNLKDNTNKKLANTQTRVEVITITPKKPYLLYYGTVDGKLFEQEINGLPLQLEPNFHNEAFQRITAIEVTQYDNKKILAIGYVNGLVKIFQANFGTFPVNRGGRLMYVPSKLHSARISNLKFNTKKQQLGVASYDGTASLWDLTVPDLRQYQPIVFDDNGSWIQSFAFSPKNDQVLLGNRDGEILFFNADPTIYAKEIKYWIDNAELKNQDEIYNPYREILKEFNN